MAASSGANEALKCKILSTWTIYCLQVCRLKQIHKCIVHRKGNCQQWSDIAACNCVIRNSIMWWVRCVILLRVIAMHEHKNYARHCCPLCPLRAILMTPDASSQQYRGNNLENAITTPCFHMMIVYRTLSCWIARLCCLSIWPLCMDAYHSAWLIENNCFHAEYLPISLQLL